MKKIRLLQFCLLFVAIILVEFLPLSSIADEYIVCGYSEANGFPVNGATGSITDDTISQRAYFPDGLSVFVDGSIDHMSAVKVHIMGLKGYEVLIDGQYLVSPDEYLPMVDFPKLYSKRRTVVFAALNENDTSVLKVLPSDSATSMQVIASTDSYYLVSDGELCGFVRKDDGLLMECTETHRHYDQHMMYFEDMFVAGDKPVSARITEDSAVGMVKAEILRRYPLETAEHLESLDCAVYYDLSHEHGMWGPVWTIIFYGETQPHWELQNPYYFTPFFQGAPYTDCRNYEIDDHSQEIVLTADYPDDYMPDQMHVHYIATVIINRETNNVFFLSIR